MSRIGNKPVAVPSGVQVTLAESSVSVKGPKGQLSMAVVDGVSFEQNDGQVSVVRLGDSPQLRANHGLMRALLANMVHGVSTGFEKKLEIVGVGYKADVKGSTLTLNLGYSHPIVFPFPDGITIKAEGPTKLTVMGIDKEQVGQTAAVIRGFRSPDSYKGKGVRYAGEYIRLKAGKSGQ